MFTFSLRPRLSVGKRFPQALCRMLNGSCPDDVGINPKEYRTPTMQSVARSVHTEPTLLLPASSYIISSITFQVKLPSSCSFIVDGLVFCCGCSHYMFRPTWPSSGV
jgi:hypothetical protein